MNRIQANQIRPGMYIAGLLAIAVKPQRIEEVSTQHGTTRVRFANGIVYRFSMSDIVIRFPEYEALHRVANLNPDNPEIGAGMLRTIVAEAREAIEWK